MINKNGPQAVKKFTMLAYNQFGMCIVVLAAFVDTKEDSLIILWVQASIHIHFLQSQAVSITTTKMVGHL
jgi:hypothetical protein